ncbi:MAG: 23S rRNA (guanosine(2251)-2'-O)-methyltransferase RlmB [Prevotellaceae bacterium]|jgi:23S rRNA (guanosine2251-2'-O)-methyltransferase|nr:23S rRNA (guanosine(2251)-2'-O)-methyltransferase RlmB [Prevotellaceae bacterium]
MLYKTKQRPEREMIFGTRAVIEAIRAGKNIEKILIRRDMNNALSRELYASFGQEVIPVQKVPAEKLDRLTTKNHQGVVAFTSPVTYQHITDIVPMLYEQGRVPFVVVLDNITDVRNFGAIARTCECAGVDAIVIGTVGSAAVNADAIKTSTGALMKIPVCREQNLAKTVTFLANSGLKPIAVTEKTDTNYTQPSYVEPVVLVFGAEDEGISAEVLRLCSERAAIPVFGNIQSLNVSVAAGILMYEVVRQRKK